MYSHRYLFLFLFYVSGWDQGLNIIGHGDYLKSI